MFVPDWGEKELREWREGIPALEEALGYTFTDQRWLQEAMTHRSFVHEAGTEAMRPYERLEFLGDAVVELVISHLLWERYPNVSEGDLTRLRAELVKRGTLARLARRLLLGKMLLLGKGERQRGGEERSSILSDAMEALLGAVYLDGGISAARISCLRIMRPELQQLDINKLPNYKNHLQELAASRQLAPPRYRLIEVQGPEHNPTFVMEVSIAKTHRAEGQGQNKKAATQEAARHLLGLLQQEEPTTP